jgi:signal peptidase I
MAKNKEYSIEEILSQYGAKSKIKKRPTEVIFVPKDAYSSAAPKEKARKPEFIFEPPTSELIFEPAENEAEAVTPPVQAEQSPRGERPRRIDDYVATPSVTEVLGELSGRDDGPYIPEYYFSSHKRWDAKDSDRPVPRSFTDIDDRRTPIVTRRDFCNWLESLVSTAAVVLLFMVFIARVNQVYGVSMQPTLTEGDRLIVTPLYTELNYGDIIVLEAPNLPNSYTGEMGEPIVKRVIGLPGDEIFISNQTGEVYRNSERIEELYIKEKILPFKVGNQIYPLIIGTNEVFVMGDNRNHSTDSRITAGDGVVFYVGMVETSRIIGKAIFRIYPLTVFGSLS